MNTPTQPNQPDYTQAKPYTPNYTGRETIAVMDGSRIMCNDGRVWPLHPEKLNDGVLYAYVLAKTVRDLGIHQLWIHPSWPGVLEWNTPGHAQSNGGARWTLGGAADPHEHWHVCFQAGTYGAVDIVEVAKDIKSSWREAATGADLLNGLTKFQRLVGIEYKRTPGATGTNLIRWAHGHKNSIKLDVPGDFPPPALNPSTELPRQWLRALTPAERGRAYLHSYDKNMMYVSACSALPLGVGDPAHVGTSESTWAIRSSDIPGLRTKKTSGERIYPPGYWRVRVEIPRTSGTPIPALARGDFPLSFPIPRKGQDSVWITTPTLSLLRELGYVLCIYEAWVWERSHRYLEQWYHAVRTARNDLNAAKAEDEPGAALALAVLKESAAAASGRLSSRRWDRSEDRLYRPDWRHAMIAEANAKVYRQGLNCVRDGFIPFALGSDAWYFVSDEPDPVAACPPALTLGEHIGEWKEKDKAVPLAVILPVLDAGGGRYDALLRLQKALNILRDGGDVPADLLGLEDEAE